MNDTKIEWCDMTWNPVTGCKHGCEYCYARRVANRFGCGAGDGGEHFLGEPMMKPKKRRTVPVHYSPAPALPQTCHL